MEYPQRYSWVMRFDENNIIVEVGLLHMRSVFTGTLRVADRSPQVRAYLDSAMVQKAVDSNS